MKAAREHVRTRACAVCGTWTCAACGWPRLRAAIWRPAQQSCARCGSGEGTMAVFRHGRRTWEDHMFGFWPDRRLRARGIAPVSGKVTGP